MASKIILEKGEEVILQCRRHWIVYVLEIVVLSVLFLLPYVLYGLLGLNAAYPAVGKTYHLLLFSYTAWFILLWTYFFISWTHHHLDVYIVTTKRIIDIDQVRLFHREMSSFRLEKIQDITVEVNGLLATMLKYGDVIIQTAGENRELSISHVPNPWTIKERVNTQYHRVMDALNDPQKVADD